MIWKSRKKDNKRNIHALEQAAAPHNGEAYKVEYMDWSTHILDDRNAVLAGVIGNAVAVSPNYPFTNAIIENTNKGKEE